MRVFGWICLAVLGILVLGASVLLLRDLLRPRGPRYTICMGNKTHYYLEDVAVYYGSQIAAACGNLVQGGYASYSFVTLPVPDEAVVTWTEPDGTHYAPKVSLAGVAPRSPRNLNIWFIIEEDSSVTVTTVRADDRPGRERLVQSLIPYEVRQNKAEPRKGDMKH